MSVTVVCAKCSHGVGRDRVQVRHPLAVVRVCKGPVAVAAPVVTSVVPFVPAPVVEAPAPAAPARVFQTGDLYELDGELFRLRKARGAAHFYAGRLVRAVAGEPLGFEYVGAAPVARLRRGEGSPISAARAAELGRLAEHCCFCSRPLSDDGPARSVMVGYGPRCAEKRGLPWG